MVVLYAGDAAHVQSQRRHAHQSVQPQSALQHLHPCPSKARHGIRPIPWTAYLQRGGGLLTYDDGILLVEDVLRQDLEHAGEDHQGLRFALAGLPQAVHVGGELVEQVVDDLRGEDADRQLVGHGLRVRIDAHVEGQDGGELRLLLLVHDVGAHHVLLVDRADADVAHGDGRLAAALRGRERLGLQLRAAGKRGRGDVLFSEELQQGLQGAQGGGVHHDALAVRLQGLQQLVQVLLHVALHVLHVIAQVLQCQNSISPESRAVRTALLV